MENLDIDILTNMIVDLKAIECNCEKCNWENNDCVSEYNELLDKIIDYLKRVL